MRSAGLRNKPVDRRYLSDQDKSDYNNSGEYGQRATALARARGRRGQMAYQASRPMNTSTRTPGTGGFCWYRCTARQTARVWTEQAIRILNKTSQQQGRHV